MRLLGNVGASPSAQSSWRLGAEWALRLVALGLLVWSLVHLARGRGDATAEIATSDDLSARLVRWSTVTAPARVHVALDYPPSLIQRDWLAALPGVGTDVAWSGTALVPTAAAVEPIADPVGGVDLSVAAPAGMAVELRDALGPFDTVTASGYGTRIYLPTPPATIEAAVGPVVARAPRRDSLVLGRLLVLGHASWEAKFVHAALEERGWKVDAFLAFSPKGQGHVRQGTIGPIDTATYATVLALDTVAANYADQLTRYVRSGGGLVLWAPAAQMPALATLTAGTNADVLPNEEKAPSDSAPRAALTMAPMTKLRPDAVVLERQGQLPMIVARRVGPGRVLQLGYIDTWRWRMAGFSDDAPAAHREWLARLVANVAYAGRRALPAASADVAPLATLVDRLGPASASGMPRRGDVRFGAWMFAAIVLALVLEWASRRLRGAA